MTNTRPLAFLAVLVLIGVTLFRITRPGSTSRWHTAWIAMVLALIIALLTDLSGGGLGAIFGIAVVGVIGVKTAASAGGLFNKPGSSIPAGSTGTPTPGGINTAPSHSVIPTPTGPGGFAI